MTGKGLAAIIVFGLVYAVIIAGEKSPRKLDRPAAGLLGGVLMVVCGVLNRQEAIQSIDFATIALLLGMMIVVHYATSSGLLDALASHLLARSHSARQLLWSVCLASGVLSALFVNDTICLLMTPLLLAVTRRARLQAEPYLLGLATSSNVGSVMTVTGNPQNILIGQSSHWTWGAFALRMVPLGAVCLLLNAAIVDFLYRREMRAATFDGTADQTAEAGTPLHKRLAAKTVLVMAGLLLAFIGGAPMDVAALVAAGVLIVLANRPSEETFAQVDWALLLFFAGLFVVVEGVTKTQGLWIARLVPAFTHHTGSLGELGWFSFGTVVGSNVFSNVPFVMLLRGWIAHLPHAPLLWLTLAMASTFAGNLTLVGSVANLIVAQRAKEECPLSFWTFLKVGVPSTLLTTTAAVLILWLYGLLHWD
jgi:Na+/H+ antiporter NhaD/arsenite permease-like protein